LLAWAGAGEALSTATLQGGAIVLFALIANELVPDWQASSTIKAP
jgi:hypothetical protein